MALGRILVNGKFSGIGFALATKRGGPSRIVLTANHVVRDQSASSLKFATEDGRLVEVDSVEPDEVGDLDVAVLHLREEVPAAIEVGHALEGEAWKTRARPKGDDPYLGGTIMEPRRPYTKNEQETHVVQLRLLDWVGGHKGYSGSPVVQSSPGAVIGVLIEEQPLRVRRSGDLSNLAGNVLYATPIEDVLERFKLDAVWATPVSKAWLPRPPEHLVVREDELRRVKDDLLLDASERIEGGRRIALVGMGGTGKTVLAKQLARDQDVQRTFPDGVVWLELDEMPLVRHQARLAAALGDTGQTFQDWRQGLDHLSRLLAERECLLVLDNIRQAAELEAFDALGPRGRLLFTTRQEDLANTYGASVHNVGLLSAELARRLLASSAGLDANALPTEADGVLEECGGLPLAIAMAGAMVRGRPRRWRSLLSKLRNADVNQITARLPGYPHPNLLAALDVSVKDLDAVGQERGLEAPRDRYVDLVVFAEHGAVPEAALTALWSRAAVGEDVVGDYAPLFVVRSRATWEAEGRLRLHD
jgi:ABC-type dipeptide/oligopeptide/nickel transport system ATPase component